MARSRFERVAREALTRPGFGQALVTALLVYAFFVVSRLLVLATDVLGVVASGGQPLGDGVGVLFGAQLPPILLAPLGFVLGVVLGFWQVAPLAPQLRMAHVVTRSLLAAVIGGGVSALLNIVVVLVTQLAVGLVPFAFAGSLVIGEISTALRILIDGLVVVPLAGLLLWGWLQNHRPRRAPRGAIDEV